MLLFAIIMFGLIYRSKKEEQALAQAFGRQWEFYMHHVPGWFPRLESLLQKDRNKHSQ
jgi:protein-S-isoprenylcysteine O-methyltransferase Ste14